MNSKFHPRFILSFLLLSLFLLGVAQAQTPPNLAGTYSVAGTNPGNTGSYTGMATIAKDGEKYKMHWQVGTTYDGVGTLSGNTFTAEWGTDKAHVGTVTYTLQKDGSLKGTWYDARDPKNLGTETLTPMK